MKRILENINRMMTISNLEFSFYTYSFITAIWGFLLHHQYASKFLQACLVFLFSIHSMVSFSLCYSYRQQSTLGTRFQSSGGLHSRWLGIIGTAHKGRFLRDYRVVSFQTKGWHTRMIYYRLYASCEMVDYYTNLRRRVTQHSSNIDILIDPRFQSS